MKPSSPGIRAALWLNENEGADLNHQGRVRVANKINALVKADVMKERRRCARICEQFASDADALLGGHSAQASAARKIHMEIIRGVVRLSGRAATTPKDKTGGTRKRRAAKRDKGTADGRAVGGSNPPHAFSPAQEARALFRERCNKVRV